jgi:hypothetical protein
MREKNHEVEIFKWKTGMKDDFSCMPFQWDGEGENDS